jgi:hypothetical protein
MRITNGLSPNEDEKTANGMGCFAAQLIAALKDEPGNVYIRNTSPDSHGEEFIYTLSEYQGKIRMVVKSGRITMFGAAGDDEDSMGSIYAGPAEKFHEFLEEAES